MRGVLGGASSGIKKGEMEDERYDKVTILDVTSAFLCTGEYGSESAKSCSPQHPNVLLKILG
jgi:hypothetical protein